MPKKKSPIHTHPDSPLARKLALAFLVFMAAFYNFSVLDWNKKISRLTIDPPVQNNPPTPLRKDIQKMVAGYPLEKMTPFISRRDPSTAAFLVSIAKKESNWGRRSPRLDGKDCFNYWGYRGKGEKVTWDGYTCFDNPKQAVSVVGKRITQLIKESNLDTPEKMVVWKCGWDCSWDNSVSVRKWIRDVDYYYKKINPQNSST